MIYYSDGWCQGGNPSETGGGFTVTNVHGDVMEEGEVQKKGFTNNEAELLGAAKAIQIAEKDDTVIVDSTCVVSWITNGIQKKSRIDLRPLAEDARREMLEKNINLIWRPREENLAGQYNEEVHGA